MKSRRIDGKNGMTLMELIIVIALVAVIAAVGYNALYFGLKSYSEAQKKWEAEVAVRYMAELLTKQLETANYLDIRKDPTGTWYTSPNVQYIFVDNDQIMYQNSTASATPLVKLNQGKMEIEFTKPLNVSAVVNPGDPPPPVPNVLSFKIIARDTNGIESYSISSSVAMKNFLPGTDLPAGSLYSVPTALQTVGDSIKFVNGTKVIIPQAPVFNSSCLIPFSSPPSDLNSPPN